MKYKRKDLLNEICPKTKEENCELVKDLFTYVCRKARDWTYKPDNLILNVPKLGRFIVRKAKLEKRKYEIEPFIGEDCSRHLEHREKLEWINAMLDKYKDFIEDKHNIRKINYKDDYDPNYKTTKYLKNGS